MKIARRVLFSLLLAALLDGADTSGAAEGAARDAPDAKVLFHDPVALLDREGRPIVMRRAVGHPAVCDLNADGSMDILYTGGVFTKGDETRVHVLYGKVPNVPKAPAANK